MRTAEGSESVRPSHALLWAGAILVAATGGCSANSTVAAGPTPVRCQVAVAAPSASLGADGGSSLITVTTAAECPWDASTSTGWLSGLSPTSGQGPATITFRAAPNPLPAIREGDIAVNDSHVRLTQQAACRVTLRSAGFTIGANGGDGEIGVSASSGCSWTAETDASWIAFTTPATGRGDGSVGISIAPLGGGERRQGTIVVGDQRFTVTQEAPRSACEVRISSTSQGFVPSQGADVSATVSASTGCAWTASSNVAWIAVLAGATGTGDGAVVFRVATNPGGIRTGTVTVAGETFTLTQAAAPATSCSYAIAPSGVALDQKAKELTVTVSAGAGCGWTARSNANWIAVTSGGGGSGNGSVQFKVAKNSGPDRTGTLTIAGQTFTVRQGGGD